MTPMLPRRDSTNIVFVAPSWEPLRVDISSLAEDDRACNICTVQYGTHEDGDEPEYCVRLPSCDHKAHHFGHRCLGKWLQYSNVCPTDRRPLTGVPCGSWVVRSRAKDTVYSIARSVIQSNMSSRQAFIPDDRRSEALTAFFELVDGAVLANNRARELGLNDAHKLCCNHLFHRFEDVWKVAEGTEFDHVPRGCCLHEALFVAFMQRFEDFEHDCWPGAEAAFWMLLGDLREEIGNVQCSAPEDAPRTDMGIKITVLRFLMTFMTDDSDAWVPEFADYTA